MRFILALILLNLAQLCYAQSASPPAKAQTAAPRKPALFVDYRTVNMNAPKFRALLANKSVDRLILPFLIDGQTAFASKQPEFSFYLEKDRISYVRETIALAKSHGVPVYAYLDLLHWRGAGYVAPAGALPVWAELVYGGSAGNTRLNGLYATPFADSVWKTLTDFLRETQTEFPGLSGLYLRLELPTSTFYGYNPMARAASIRAIQIDPVDVETAQPDDKKTMHAAHADFRLRRVNERMKDFCETAHNINSEWNIALVCDPTIYAQEVRERSRSLNDWLSWLSLPGVTDVLYTDAVTENSNDNLKQSELLRGRINPAITGATMRKSAPSKKGDTETTVGQVVYTIRSDADIDALPK